MWIMFRSDEVIVQPSWTDRQQLHGIQSAITKAVGPEYSDANYGVFCVELGYVFILFCAIKKLRYIRKSSCFDQAIA